jgi:hypothetical protein
LPSGCNLELFKIFFIEKRGKFFSLFLFVRQLNIEKSRKTGNGKALFLIDEVD